MQEIGSTITYWGRGLRYVTYQKSPPPPIFRTKKNSLKSHLWYADDQVNTLHRPTSWLARAGWAGAAGLACRAGPAATVVIPLKTRPTFM